MRVGLILVFFLLVGRVCGQVQIGQDIEGQAIFDGFGGSVSLSADGNRVAIGATGNDEVGDLAGQVRIYDKIDSEWIQIGSDINGEASNDVSGYSVSLSADGNRVAIGAPFNDGSGNEKGHARIYEEINNEWIQIGSDIEGEADYDWLGFSVSLSSDGNRVAVGAHKNDGTAESAGHARIYEEVNDEWIQVGNDIDGEAFGDASGRSVLLSSDGERVAVGAYQNEFSTGHARIYEEVNDEWIQVGNDIDGEAFGDFSGYSVSLSSDGERVAIGAYQNDGAGDKAGHARIYEEVNNEWIQIGNDIDGEAANDWSGFSVSLSSNGNRIAIGAHKNDGAGDKAGHVRIYEEMGGEWVQVGDDIDGEAANDNAGRSVSLSSNGEILAIGAPLNDGAGNGAGQVRIYSLTLPCNPTTSIDTITVCDNYTWLDGNTYTSNNNTATYTTINSVGCDSIITLSLIINNSTASTDEITACDSYLWLDGNTYTTNNNIATFATANSLGCDSLITLNLTINNSTTSTDENIACDSYTWLDGNTYTSNNTTATFTTTNSVGCDSIITLDLIINNITTSTDEITACDSYLWLDGNTYTSNNSTATFTTTNSAGCDSIITLDLTINTADTSVTENGNMLSANASNASYQWLDCDNNENIPGETEQTFIPTSSGNYAVEVTQDGCVGISSCYDVIVTNLKEHSEVVDLKLFPNPVKAGEMISFELPTIQSNGQWEIQFFDALGKEVESTTFSGQIISIKSPTTVGQYTVQVRNDEEETYIRKLIVLK